MPAPPSPPANPRRRDKRLALAVEVLAELARLQPTPDVGELAGSLRWPTAKLSPVLAAMRRSGLVETWDDPDRPGVSRVMFSARALARLGLVLAPRGDRWNPNRPPTPRRRSDSR
jgi:DNA-binding IclR family transcriptional regulator